MGGNCARDRFLSMGEIVYLASFVATCINPSYGFNISRVSLEVFQTIIFISSTLHAGINFYRFFNGKIAVSRRMGGLARQIFLKSIKIFSGLLYAYKN